MLRLSYLGFVLALHFMQFAVVLELRLEPLRLGCLSVKGVYITGLFLHKTTQSQKKAAHFGLVRCELFLEVTLFLLILSQLCCQLLDLIFLFRRLCNGCLQLVLQDSNFTLQFISQIGGPFLSQFGLFQCLSTNDVSKSSIVLCCVGGYFTYLYLSVLSAKLVR